MDRHLRLGLLTVCFVSACVVSDSVWAQKGRGKGGGGSHAGKKGSGGFQGGEFKAGGNKGGRQIDAGHQSGGDFGSQSHFHGKSSKGNQLIGKKADTFDPASQLTGNHPGDKQRLNEERKLEHRRNVANHLRELSAKNGNENLNHVADRLDQKAQEHYDKRIAKLNDRDGILEDADGAPGGDADGDLLGSAGDAAQDASVALADVAATKDQVTDVAQKLTGRENALYRQLRNEERKLDERMAAVERLNQLYEQTGDAQYLDAADRMESMALDHYEARLARITEFQERFHLPAIERTPTLAP